MIRNESVSVGTDLVILSAIKKRNSFYAYNSSTGTQVITVTVSSSQSAVAGAGYVLKPGASMALSNNEGYRVPVDTITAIGDGASGTLAIVEDVEF